MKLIFYEEKGHHLYSFYLIGLISLCKTKLTKNAFIAKIIVIFQIYNINPTK